MNTIDYSREITVERQASISMSRPSSQQSTSSPLPSVRSASSPSRQFRSPGKTALLPSIAKPANYDFWVRSVDDNGTVYYYNSMSGESTWLLPCNICYKTADRWCIQCNLSYCERHFVKKHDVPALPPKPVEAIVAAPSFPEITDGDSNRRVPESNNSTDLVPIDLNTSVQDEEDDEDTLDPNFKPVSLERKQIEANDFALHEWSQNELEDQMTKEDLGEGDEYCVRCIVKVSTKLCAVCWDGYCNKCFDIVHHVGALKTHKPLNYKRAKMTWYIQRAKNGRPETYINGANGDIRLEKPLELMSDLERVLLENWKMHNRAVEGYFQKVEELQKDLVNSKRERDKVTVEMAQLAANFKAKMNSK